MNLSEIYRKHLNESILKEGLSDRQAAISSLRDQIITWVNTLKVPTKSEINKEIKDINSWNDTNITINDINKIPLNDLFEKYPMTEYIDMKSRSDVPKAVKVLNSLGYVIDDKKFEKLYKSHDGEYEDEYLAQKEKDFNDFTSSLTSDESTRANNIIELNLQRLELLKEVYNVIDENKQKDEQKIIKKLNSMYKGKLIFKEWKVYYTMSYYVDAIKNNTDDANDFWILFKNIIGKLGKDEHPHLWEITLTSNPESDDRHNEENYTTFLEWTNPEINSLYKKLYNNYREHEYDYNTIKLRPESPAGQELLLDKNLEKALIKDIQCLTKIIDISKQKDYTYRFYPFAWSDHILKDFTYKP